jgi:hypothetical protein
MDVKAGQSAPLPEDLGEAPLVHNSVLISTHEPRGSMPRWLMPLALVVAVCIGAGAWAFMGAHPPPPLVNHAVAVTQGPAYQTGG